MALVLPILIAMYLFSADMFFFSKSKTNVTQVTRDAAIFFALAPGNLTQTQQNNLHLDQDMQQICSADPSETDCAAVIAHRRVFLMLDGIKSYMDMDGLNISSNYDGSKIHLTVSAPTKTKFFFSNETITRTATLRRIGS